MDDCIRRVRDFKAIGDTFTYLGIEMIVTSHSQMTSMGEELAGLVANYKTKNDEIKQIRFSIQEIDALRAENDNS